MLIIFYPIILTALFLTRCLLQICFSIKDPKCANTVTARFLPILLLERGLSGETDDVIETCRKRSEGRLKNYTSCTDSRAWHFDKDQRRRYLIDLMRKDTGRKGYCIPVTMLYELLCCSSENELSCCERVNRLTIRKALKSLRNILRVVRLSGNTQPPNICVDMKCSAYNIPMACIQSNLNLIAARIKKMSEFVGCNEGQNCEVLGQLHELDSYVKCIQSSITRFGEEMSEHLRVLLVEVENLYAELKNKGLRAVKSCSRNPSQKGSVCSVNLVELEVGPGIEINQDESEELCENNDLLENCDGIEEEVRKLKQLADSSKELQFLLDESIKKCKFLSKESDIIRSERDFLRVVVENMKNQEEEYKASLSKVEAIVKMYDKVFSEKHKLLIDDCRELREKNSQLTKLIKGLHLTRECQVSVTSLSKEVCSLWRIPPEKLSSAQSADSMPPRNAIDKPSDCCVTRQVSNRRRKHLSNRSLPKQQQLQQQQQQQRKPDSRCHKTICTACVPQCSDGDIEFFLRYEEKN